MSDIPSTPDQPGSDPTSESASGSVRDLAAGAAQSVKQEAASFAATAQEKAVEQVEKHKETATQTLGAFADAIRQAGDQLAQNDQSAAGHMVRQAADGLESFTRSLEGKRPEELVDAVRDFGRRNPTVFIAGSVLAGLALARFLKASAENDPQSEPSQATGGAPAYGQGSDPTASAQSGGWTPEAATSAGQTAALRDGDVRGELEDDASTDGGLTPSER